MHRILIVPLAILLATLSVEVSAANVAYTKRVMRGVGVHVVTANLNSPNVKVTPAISRHGIGTSEGFGSMLSRLQPKAAITGTFFGVKRLLPIGDIVIDGEHIYRGGVGTALCITPDNKVDFLCPGYYKSRNWDGYQSVIRSGPHLVKNGVVSITPRAEGFSDPAFFRSSRRTAIAVTAHNKLLMVTVLRPISVRKLAYILKDLGAVNAIQLDGGSSSAMYYDGRVLCHPGRRLTNLLVVYDSGARYAGIKPQLAPSANIASESGDSRS